MKEKIKNKSNIQTHYHLKLFVAGDEPNSYKAKKTIERLCESCLKGNYKLEVVDVLKDYQVALDNNILIAPTLVIVAPPTSDYHYRFFKRDPKDSGCPWAQ